MTKPMDYKMALDQAMACAPYFWQDDQVPEERRASSPKQTTAKNAFIVFSLPHKCIIHVTGTANGPQGAYAVACTLTVRLQGDGRLAVTLATDADLVDGPGTYEAWRKQPHMQPDVPLLDEYSAILHATMYAHFKWQDAGGNHVVVQGFKILGTLPQQDGAPVYVVGLQGMAKTPHGSGPRLQRIVTVRFQKTGQLTVDDATEAEMKRIRPLETPKADDHGDHKVSLLFGETFL